MLRRFASGILLATALFAAGGALFFACSQTPPDEDAELSPLVVSRGVLTASLNRYIEIGSDAPFEQFGMMGMFFRYDVDRIDTVNSLIDTRLSEVDLALDSCSMPARVLDETPVNTHGKGNTPIELLDVGDLSISFDSFQKPVPTRTFPDLLKVIVGVIYTADENQGVSFRPGETYDLRATGSEDVSPFRVALEAPEDIGEVKVDGIAPGNQVPFIRRGEDVELTWEGDGYGDEVVATLGWMSMGASWSMTCRMRDDGLFIIPATVTGALSDPLTSSEEELTVVRVRQVAFRSAGLSSGSFQFSVSTNFPVTF